MTPREHVRQLLDELSDEQVAKVEQYIATVIEEEDPVLRAFLEAEIDDEPLTPEELEGIEEGRRDFEHGRVIRFEEAERRLLNK